MYTLPTSELTAAYEWLCRRRKRFPANDDVWHLRHSWRKVEPQMIHELKRGLYRLSPMRIVGRAEPLAIWSAADALALKWLAQRLKPLLPVHPRCEHMRGHGGGRASIARVAAALRGGGYRWVCRADIRGYYAQIDKNRLYQQVARRVKDPALLGLLRQFLHYSVERGGEFHTPARGIPRGCALSPLLAAFHLYETDRDLAGREGVYYARYMDDFIILTRSRWALRRQVRQLNQHLEHHGFELHPDKTFIGRVSKGFDWMGAQLSSPGVVGIAARALANYHARLRRLYERLGRRPLGALLDRVSQYRKRWWGWAKALAVAGRGRHSRPPNAHSTTKKITVLLTLLQQLTNIAYSADSATLNAHETSGYPANVYVGPWEMGVYDVPPPAGQNCGVSHIMKTDSDPLDGVDFGISLSEAQPNAEKLPNPPSTSSIPQGLWGHAIGNGWYFSTRTFLQWYTTDNLGTTKYLKRADLAWDQPLHNTREWAVVSTWKPGTPPSADNQVVFNLRPDNNKGGIFVQADNDHYAKNAVDNGYTMCGASTKIAFICAANSCPDMDVHLELAQDGKEGRNLPVTTAPTRTVHLNGGSRVCALNVDKNIVDFGNIPAQQKTQAADNVLATGESVITINCDAHGTLNEEPEVMLNIQSLTTPELTSERLEDPDRPGFYMTGDVAVLPSRRPPMPRANRIVPLQIKGRNNGTVDFRGSAFDLGHTTAGHTTLGARVNWHFNRDSTIREITPGPWHAAVEVTYLLR